ncbi:MAG: hypothetical protein ABJB97_01065 [Acidobacteriota bacterium]
MTKRSVSSFCLIVLLAAMANAYTIVMRGGRRVEVPADFAVTLNTLTYEISPGIQVTLLVSAIDVAATERANKEPAGSLLKRSRVVPVRLASTQTARESSAERNSAHSITDRDLEAYKQKREQSEVAYEKRRRELGLPSLQESRQRAAAETAAMNETFARKQSEEMESESYWRGQASALRTEMTGVDAEIHYTRRRLDEVYANSGFNSFAEFPSLVPFGAFGSNVGRSSFNEHSGPRPNIVRAPTAQLRGGVGFGGGFSRGRVFVNPGMSHFPRRDVRGSRSSFFPNTSLFGWPVQQYDYSYEGSALVARLDELMALRSALNARWRTLEDDARRAGAPPGWLRP